MYICLCHAVTDKEINEVMQNGVSSTEDLIKYLNVTTQCGRCIDELNNIVDRNLTKMQEESNNRNIIKGVNIYHPLPFTPS